MLRKIIHHIKTKPCPVKAFVLRQYNKLGSFAYTLHYISLCMPTQHWITDWKQVFKKELKSPPPKKVKN